MNLIFQEVEHTLKQFELQIDAAHFHGMLSGLICAGIEDREIDDWLPVLMSGRHMPQEDYQLLSDQVLDMYQEVRTELEKDGFGFEVLLPDDGNSLDYRAGMLGSWCRGYLIALVDYAETAVEALPDDCVEFVSDVEQMVELEVDDDESEDILDESFMVLEEHLRVGVQLVFEHMNPLQSAEEMS